MRRRPNIDLAKEVLQWSPTVPLEEGLARTVEYFKSVLPHGDLVATTSHL